MDAAAAAASAFAEESADVLLQKLRLIPHHSISLRRNKYRVIRRIARYARRPTATLVTKGLAEISLGEQNTHSRSNRPVVD